jgi:hypothetical protein
MRTFGSFSEFYAYALLAWGLSNTGNHHVRRFSLTKKEADEVRKPLLKLPSIMEQLYEDTGRLDLVVDAPSVRIPVEVDQETRRLLTRWSTGEYHIWDDACQLLLEAEEKEVADGQELGQP